MKLITFLLLLSFGLWASNMSLGPYNKEDFISIEEQQKRAKEIEALQSAKQKAQLKAFYKRQDELKQQRREAKKERLRLAREKQKKIQEKIQAQKDEATRRQIEANLRIKEKEEQYKQQLHMDFQEKQEKLLENKKRSIAVKESEDSSLSLTPEQADISVNNPDDIDTEIENINRLRYILLYSKRTPEFIKEYIRLLDDLNKNYNIDVAFAYRAIAQAELDSSTFGGGGKYDLSMRYRPSEETHFALKLEGQHQVRQYNSVEFKDEFGALTSTSASYKKERLYLSQLWVQHSLGDFVLRAGKIDPSSFIDSHLFKSNSRFFFNGTFSSSSYNSYPSNGIGFAGKYEKQAYYITAEITDANGVKDEINDDFFTEKEFYSALEFGITPKNGSKYHLTLWNRDSSKTKAVTSKGLITSVVQALDTNTHLILRAAFSDHATATRYASVGLGKFSLFKEHDISGISLGTLVPEDKQDRVQTAIESFYRIDPLPGVQLSADLQIIYHPSQGTQTWALLPGLRLRVLF